MIKPSTDGDHDGHGDRDGGTKDGGDDFASLAVASFAEVRVAMCRAEPADATPPRSCGGGDDDEEYEDGEDGENKPKDENEAQGRGGRRQKMEDDDARGTRVKRCPSHGQLRYSTGFSRQGCG